MATDTLTPWTALTPSRKKAVPRDFPGNETIGYHIGYHIAKMLNEAGELMDVTPDEYEAFCDRQGA